MNKLLLIHRLAILATLQCMSAFGDNTLVNVFAKIKLGESPKYIQEIRPNVTAESILGSDGEGPSLEEVLKSSEEGRSVEISLMEKINKTSLFLFYFKDNKLNMSGLAFRPLPAEAVPTALLKIFGGLANAEKYSDRGSIIVEWKTEEEFVWYTFSEEAKNPNVGIQKFTSEVRRDITSRKKLEALSEAQRTILEAHFREPKP